MTRTVALVWLVSFSVPDPSGSLWVGAWRDRQVVRVDPRSNRVVARFPAGGRNPAGLAVGAGTNWVVHPDTDEVVRLELGTGRVVARIKLGPLPFQVAPGDDRFLPSLVAVGAGPDRLPAGRGAVARIDAATDRVREIVPTGLPIGLAAAAGAVWVPDRRGSLVYRLVRDDLLIEVEAVAVVASFQPMTATAPA